MKELLDKIKEKYGRNWLEILLMIVFVVAALALNASEISSETIAVFGSNVNKPGQGAVQAASEETIESEEEEAAKPEEADEARSSSLDEDDAASDGAEKKTVGDKKTVSGDAEEDNSGFDKAEKDDAEERERGTEKTGGRSDDMVDAGADSNTADKDGVKTGKEKPGGTDADASDAGSTKPDGTGANGSDAGSTKSGRTSVDDTNSASADDAKDGPASEYELFTLQDTKKIRDLYPIYLPGVTGPVEYWKVWEDPDLAEYQIVEYQSSDRNLTLLQKMIENRIKEYDGDWSVYVKNLSTDESIVINNQPMKSASVMKLFIMGTVYKAMEAGELERTDEVMSLMNSMITVSDNEASNQLLYLLGDESYEDGIAKVDEFIREYGFSEMTVEYNGFNNSATIMDSDNFNQVSAQDCGKLLEDIYRRTWVNRSVSNEIEEMLLNQHTRYKIPAGLPEGVLCGNKTGEMDTTENDAAIIYAEDCDYILVVLSSDWNSKDEAISRIASLSGMVYEFLN